MKYPHNFLIRFVLCFLPPAVFSLLFTQITIYFSYIMLYVYNPIIEGNILSIKDLKFVCFEIMLNSPSLLNELNPVALPWYNT